MCRFSSSLVCDLCRLAYSNVEPRTPILLPSCCHTFCRQCLEEWTTGGSNATQEFSCPTCKTQCDTAIESLGVNHALMAEIESKLLASGELQLDCQGCSEKAEKHCVDCNVLLCNSCERGHAGYQLFINHTIRPTREMRNPPKARQMCTKHKTKELRLFCTTCQALICDDCPIKDHKDHNYDLLEQTAGDQRAELKKQAAMVEQAIIPLQQGVRAIKQEEVALAESREATKRSIKESYDALAGAVHKRSEELRDQVDDVYCKKQKVLQEQWKGVELVVASMKSARTHVRHVSDICNDQQVAEGFRQNVTSLQDLRDKRLDLSPDASGRIGFAWPTQETSAWLMDCIAQKGKVLRGEAKTANCVAEGPGLDKAVAGQTSTFRVLTKNHLGQPCTEGGEIVLARESASEAVAAGGGSAKEFCVQDKSDGTYEVTYVAGGEGCVQIEVLIYDCAVPGSPFCVTVASAGVALRMQSAFDGNGAIYYIGTAKGTRGFQNPHDTGDVIASMSSVYSDGHGFSRTIYGAPRNIVLGRDCPQGTRNLTKNAPNSWMAVDLKSFRLAPNAYCLRTDANSIYPRNWRLEGSEDGTEWTTLREHSNDTSILQQAHCTASWSIEGFELKSFRHFRILQTGSNDSGNSHLGCAGLELYGTLSESEA